MQKKTKYCNSLVSKVLPTINEIGDNNAPQKFLV